MTEPMARQQPQLGDNHAPQPVAPPPLYPVSPLPVQPGSPPAIRRQGAWTLWWLCGVTLGVYYFIWYDRIGSELTAFTETPRAAWSQWWSQLIPIYNLIGLHRMAKLLNTSHAQVGSTVHVSPFVTWFWAPSWFASQTRYLQRRINTLAEIQQSTMTR
ncbi:MAG: hypothetical protein J2P18_05150 [Nocardia sp.]|nr:hypothetical protein [Nocardia sp.]